MGLLDDPERCEFDGTKGKVVESRHEGPYRRRRHKCPTCGHTWPTYQSRVNVQPVIARRQQRTAADAPPAPPAPSPASPPVPPRAAVPPPRRVTRSPYLDR